MFTPEALAGYVSDAFLTILNLLIAYFILRWLLFKPLLKILKKRRELVASQLQTASEKMADAEKQLNEANERLNASNHEAADIVASARVMAEQQSEETIAAARSEAAHIMSRTDEEMRRMKLAIMQQSRDEVADLSVAIASKVIGKAMDPDRQRDLVRQLIREEPSLQELDETKDGVEHA